MSSSAEVYMERERRRRELYLNRIRTNIETFLARYETVLADLHAQDLVRYVQKEVSHAETCIGLARRALVSDVEQAQAFSFEVGDLLRGLPSYARSRKRGEAAANREAARLAALKEEVQVKRRELSAEATAARGVAADALKARSVGNYCLYADCLVWHGEGDGLKLTAILVFSRKKGDEVAHSRNAEALECLCLFFAYAFEISDFVVCFSHA